MTYLFDLAVAKNLKSLRPRIYETCVITAETAGFMLPEMSAMAVL